MNVDNHIHSLPYRVVDPCTLSQFDSTCQGKSYMNSTSTLTSSPQPFNEFQQTMCKTNRGHAQKKNVTQCHNSNVNVLSSSLYRS